MDMTQFLPFLIELAVLAGLFFFFTRRRGARLAPELPIRSGGNKNTGELEKLQSLRSRHLNLPLSELSRPEKLSDIVGQSEGVRALRAALCGPNPQHVLLYGPPGIGKTCAARLVLEEAKARPDSPFTEDAQFVEMDATCIRFDERAIADPLIGSVHDPIYQGAGSLGSRGVPQPKPGAVTKAHCGVLFLDEIGELHPMQMNKLLKVLEDRRVCFESAYYSPDDANVPPHIRDIFENGLPADFRLIGATTRSPGELPPALRSRCLELHFRQLSEGELSEIAASAAARAGFLLEKPAAKLAAKYAQSGRDAVNIVQLAAGLAYNEGRAEIFENDVLWVARTCDYAPRPDWRFAEKSRPGVVGMLAVTGGGAGVAMELECTAVKSRRPRLVLGGIVESEELDGPSRKLIKKSSASCSAENVLAAVGAFLGLDFSEYDVRFNIVGGLPADGPSAGLAMALALYGAVRRECALSRIAATGEITIHGDVRPVGGVRQKIIAAAAAGAQLVFIPEACNENELHTLGVRVLPVSSISDAFTAAFDKASPPSSTIPSRFDDCAFCESHLY